MNKKTSLIRRLRAAMFKWPGMIDCAEAETLIHDFEDGSLSLGDQRRARRHFQLCPDCKSYLGAYRRSVGLGKAVLSTDETSTDEPADDAFVRAVLQSAKNSD